MCLCVCVCGGYHFCLSANIQIANPFPTPCVSLYTQVKAIYKIILNKDRGAGMGGLTPSEGGWFTCSVNSLLPAHMHNSWVLLTAGEFYYVMEWYSAEQKMTFLFNSVIRSAACHESEGPFLWAAHLRILSTTRWAFVGNYSLHVDWAAVSVNNNLLWCGWVQNLNRLSLVSSTEDGLWAQMSFRSEWSDCQSHKRRSKWVFRGSVISVTNVLALYGDTAVSLILHRKSFSYNTFFSG